MITCGKTRTKRVFSSIRHVVVQWNQRLSDEHCMSNFLMSMNISIDYYIVFAYITKCY